jgi:hypothetical protein
VPIGEVDNCINLQQSNKNRDHVTTLSKKDVVRYVHWPNVLWPRALEVIFCKFDFGYTW